MRCLPYVVLALFTSACQPAVDSRQEIDLLVVNGLIIDVVADTPPEQIDLAILDGKILATGPDLAETYRATAQYDAAGRYLIPGLADMHSHFGNAIYSDDRDDSRPVLARHLYFGNTTILNMGSAQGWTARIDSMREQIADGSLKGPRLLAVGTLFTMPGSHPTTTIYSADLQHRIAAILADSEKGKAIDLAPLRGTTLVSDADELAGEVDKLGRWGADAIKLTVESGPTEFGDDHPQMTAPMIAAAVQIASRYQIPVLCHISSVDELEACMANGAAGSVHAVVPMVPLPSDLEQRMVESGQALIPTASMFEGWARYASDPGLLEQPALQPVLSDFERQLLSSPRMREQFARGPEWAAGVERLRNHVRTFHDSGGLLVAGTDTGNPYRIAGLALHEELAFYVSAGLSERDALATATVNAARLVNAEDKWGAIRSGLAADLVVLAANPLLDIDNSLTIVDVIQAGSVVRRDSLPLH